MQTLQKRSPLLLKISIGRVLSRAPSKVRSKVHRAREWLSRKRWRWRYCRRSWSDIIFIENTEIHTFLWLVRKFLRVLDNNWLDFSCNFGILSIWSRQFSSELMNYLWLISYFLRRCWVSDCFLSWHFLLPLPISTPRHSIELFLRTRVWNRDWGSNVSLGSVVQKLPMVTSFGLCDGLYFFSEDISLSLIWLFKHLVVIFLQRSGFRIKFTMKTPHHRCSKHHLCLVQFPSWLFMLKLLQICYLMIGYPGLGPAVKRRACFIDKLVFV